jgi:hypothetical protein
MRMQSPEPEDINPVEKFIEDPSPATQAALLLAASKANCTNMAALALAYGNNSKTYPEAIRALEHYPED